MKKNKIMRIACCLVVAVLLSTCAISGTFAKYTTSDTAGDTARVAKWGVTVSITNADVFSETYASDTTTGTDAYSGNTVVSSETNQKLVAPGTKNDTGITLTIAGAPEVAVKVEVVLDITSDVKLTAKTYADNPTTGDPVADPYTLDADYTPVVYTMTKNGAAFASGTLEDIKTEIEKLNGNYDANTGLAAINGEYKLTWAWAINGNDVADTILGNAAVSAIDGATTAIEFDLTVTITQID